MAHVVRSIRRWEQGHPQLVDALLAAGLWVALATRPWEDSVAGAGDAPGTALGLLLITGLTLPLAWRRRFPLEVFGVLALVAFAQWLVTVPHTADLTLLIGLYSVAAYEPRRWGVAAACAVMAVGAVLAVTRYGGDERLVSLGAGASFIVASAAPGVWVRTRRLHIAALTERARQLERERDQQAQLGAAAERARIAREMHDVVAHSLSVMIALADGARMAAARDADAAQQAMRGVSDTGREALGEMRRLLGVLREGAATSASDPAPLRPQPDLGQLDALVEQVRAAGLATTLTRTGDPRPLGAGAQLTAYRLVQEALTNTLKHARSASRAEVRLAYGEDGLTVEVVDDGVTTHGAHGVAGMAAGARGAAVAGDAAEAAPAGLGIAGMRERAAAYGAVVEAGPLPEGGWRVRTQLPYTQAPAAEAVA